MTLNSKQIYNNIIRAVVEIESQQLKRGKYLSKKKIKQLLKKASNNQVEIEIIK